MPTVHLVGGAGKGGLAPEMTGPWRPGFVSAPTTTSTSFAFGSLSGTVSKPSTPSTWPALAGLIEADGGVVGGGSADGKGKAVASPQALTEVDRRLVAAWAADCAERVLGLFEAAAPDDGRPRALIARARAFARGELDTAGEIRRRFTGGVAAGEVRDPAAMAAARAAGQAVGACHMGAHALGAAAYAASAVGLASPHRPEAVGDEIAWQLEHLSPEVRATLRALPPVGEDPSGPLGPGLLASGQLGTIIASLQAGLAEAATDERVVEQPARHGSPVPRPSAQPRHHERDESQR